MKRFILWASLALAFSSTAAAAEGSNWPHWLGPSRDGSSPETGLLREWPAGGPEVLWRVTFAQSWACPSVVGDEVYVVGCEDGQKEYTETLACLEAKTGKELWRYTYGTGLHLYQVNLQGWVGTRATPTVTDEHVYFFGLLGKMICFNRKTHEIVWQQDHDEYWKPPAREWKGTCCSPLVEGGRLIVPLSKSTQFANDFACMALDALTGKELWRVEEPGGKMKTIPSAQTPALATFNGERCAVLSLASKIKAFRLSDGKEIWSFDTGIQNTEGGIPTPVAIGNDILIVAGHVAQAAVVTVDRSDPALPTKLKWARRIPSGSPIFSFVHHEGYLYGVQGTGDPNDVPGWSVSLYCIDLKDGRTVWEEKGFKMGASLILADGMLYVRSFQSLYLVEATPKGFILKGKVDKLHAVTNVWGRDGGWVMPVLSRGKLFIRTPNELICYKVSKE